VPANARALLFADACPADYDLVAASGKVDRHGEVRIKRHFRPKATSPAWNDATLVPPPMDGRAVCIVANLASDDGDGGYSVEPVCAIACYDQGEWVEAVTSMAICQYLGDELHILYWIAPPTK
jgi:hypothetical protein